MMTRSPHNAPEIILTESYRLQFEGEAFRSLLRGTRPHDQPRVRGRARDRCSGRGAVGDSGGRVALLIAQQVAPSRLLARCAAPGRRLGRLDLPWVREHADRRQHGSGPRGEGGPAASSCRATTSGPSSARIGSSAAAQIIRITAAASETPMIWGWSRAPYFGGLFEENVLEDAVEGDSSGWSTPGSPRRSWAGPT